jgi:hypothetical protein
MAYLCLYLNTVYENLGWLTQILVSISAVSLIRGRALLQATGRDYAESDSKGLKLTGGLGSSMLHYGLLTPISLAKLPCYPS